MMSRERDGAPNQRQIDSLFDTLFEMLKVF